MSEKPSKDSAQGCAGICIKFRAPSRRWKEEDHCFCTTCVEHMVLKKDPKATKDLCPCCGFQVRRRPIWGKSRKAWVNNKKRIGSKMVKVLLVCGHSHNTFQSKLQADWEEGLEQGRAVDFYCEDKPCKARRRIVLAWTVAI